MFKPKLIVESHPNFPEEKVLSISLFPEFNTMKSDEGLKFLEKFNYRFE